MMSLRLKRRILSPSILVGVSLLCLLPAAGFPQSISAPSPGVSTPESLVAAAKVCTDSLCRFSALQRALQLDGHYRPALHALADYYGVRHQRVKQRAILQNLAASDAKDFVARKKLADILLESGANQRALNEYFALEKDFANEHWLHLELASAYEKLGLLDRALSLAKLAFDENTQGTSERDQLLRLYKQRRDTNGLLATLERILASEPANVSYLLQLADAQSDIGHTIAAETTLRTALAKDSQNPQGQFALRDLLDRADRTEAAREQIDHTVATNTSAADLRRLQWLQDAPAETIDPDSQYLASIDISQARRSDTYGAKAIALADVRIERVNQIGLAATRVQQFFLVGDEEGARQYGVRSVQYAPRSESLQILHARLHKQNGRVIDAEESADNSVADPKAAMYYDVRARTLRYPGTEPDDIIELDYRITPETTTNPYGDYYGSLVPMQNSVPAQLRRFVLITPADREFYIAERRVPTTSNTSIADGRRVQTWEMLGVDALPTEPRGLSSTDAGAYVAVTTFPDWTALGRWYASMLAPQLQLDPALEQVAEEMLREYPGEQDRIRAIHRFVLKNTHYVALEFGIYSYKPYPASQVYARRFGDCKDKASLMIALLRATGVEAQLALVRTRRLGGFAPEAASIAPFNHAIAYIPKYDLYLDGTAEYAGARELPLDDQGAMALTVGVDGQSTLREIPVTSPDDNYTRRIVRAGIRPDGSIDFTGTASTRGEDAPGLRRDFEIPERQRESFRQTLAELFPSVQLQNVEVEGAHDLEKDVTVNFSGMLNSFTGRNTLSLSNSWMSRRYVQTLAPLATRTQPLLLPAGWGTEEELHFTLPLDSVGTELPAVQRLESPFGKAEFDYIREGRELTIRTRVTFSRTRISPDEYPAFREFCRALDAGFRQEVKITLQ